MDVEVFMMMCGYKEVFIIMCGCKERSMDAEV